MLTRAFSGLLAGFWRAFKTRTIESSHRVTRIFLAGKILAWSTTHHRHMTAVLVTSCNRNFSRRQASPPHGTKMNSVKQKFLLFMHKRMFEGLVVSY